MRPSYTYHCGLDHCWNEWCLTLAVALLLDTTVRLYSFDGAESDVAIVSVVIAHRHRNIYEHLKEYLRKAVKILFIASAAVRVRKERSTATWKG